MSTPTLSSFAQATERLKETLPGYEERIEQARLARAIEDGLAQGHHVVAEAGCGTGKSLGALIPAILSGKRVIYSTATKALQEQVAGKDLPFLAQHLGVPFTYALLKGRANYFCFGGETKIMTRDGRERLDSIYDQTHEVLDGDGNWVKAEIKEFGQQRLYEVTLTRDGVTKVVRATAEHRWFVQPNANFEAKTEVTTLDLKPGDRMPFVAPRPLAKSLRPSPFGVAHGIVFGDGTVFAETDGGFRTATVVLHGSKDAELLRYFPESEVKHFHPVGYAQPAARVCDLPVFMKQRPSLTEAPSYLYGWLAGYFAADGSVAINGSATLSSASLDTLLFVETLCDRLGIVTYGIKEVERLGKGSEPSSLYSLTFAKNTLSEDFFLLAEHRRRATESATTYKQFRAARRWKIESVVKTDAVETVYCAVVPSTASFALDGNLLTGNCKAKAIDADPRYVPVAQMEDELRYNPHHTGDREHFTTVSVDEKAFRNVSATADECPGKRKCPFGEVCYAEKAKAAAREADVVVVNHMLTFTDLKIRQVTGGFGSMLGEVDAYIFDEAHEIEEIATNAMADVVRESGVRKLSVEVTNFLTDYDRPQAVAHGNDISETVGAVWGILPVEDKTRMNQAWLVEHYEPFADLIESLELAAIAVQETRVDGTQEEEARRERLATRALNYAHTFKTALLAADETLVRWVEHDDQKNRLFKHAPLRVGPWLDEGVWSRTNVETGEPVVSTLISATLSVNGSFDYLIDRLGLDPGHTESLNVGTPFDFTSQAMLFVPPANAPGPTKERAAWLSYAPTVTMELIDASKGGALLLYTSRAAMQQAYGVMADRLRAKGIRCLMQGEHGTNKEIAKAFQDDEHSVLFALKSFFTGVDFGGDTCRLVVIDKLPFAVPTDVMFSARSEEVERHGQKAFSALTIPMMTLTLLQGFGRLIRTKNDRGVVAILDSRLSSTPYGRKIAESMPPAPQTSSLEDIKAFYGR